MLTVEMKVNGTLVHHIYAQNVEYVGDGAYMYDYTSCIPVPLKDIEPAIKTGSVVHKRDEGMAVLVNTIIKDLDT